MSKHDKIYVVFDFQWAANLLTTTSEKLAHEYFDKYKEENDIIDDNVVLRCYDNITDLVDKRYAYKFYFDNNMKQLDSDFVGFAQQNEEFIFKNNVFIVQVFAYNRHEAKKIALNKIRNYG